MWLERTMQYGKKGISVIDVSPDFKRSIVNFSTKTILNRGREVCPESF
jgi:hypothetical protein